ncbi:hypothetical protein ACFV6F_15010 [Kitasatospora phosalacinea]|uniref:hypothetical protein n=1 Tax=Kitasatospora phosalacinea TaxID=2065 RepID=UPI0036598979
MDTGSPTEHVSSPETTGLGRRTLLKAVGLGAAGTGLATGSSDTAAAAGATGPVPITTQTNTVNLYCHSTPATYHPDGTAALAITVGNFGPQAATGPVSLKVITPFYADLAALPSVDGASAEWLYRNDDADTPSIIKVTFQGFPADGTVTVPLTFTLDPGAPNRPASGRAIFTTDAGNTQDVDSDLTRNVWAYLFIRESFAAPALGNVNLHYTTNQVPLVIGGRAEAIPFRFYNGAGNLLHGTRSPAYFTFSTPFYTRVPAAGRPPGFSALYENDDPAVPSVYRLALPPGIGALGSAVPTTVPIPLQAQAGAPASLAVASAAILPSGSDHQGDVSIAHHLFGFPHVTDTPV